MPVSGRLEASKNMVEKPPLEIEARFNAILEEYGKFLRRTVVRLCPKDLGLDFNDIEQEARLRLWRALQSEREITDLASYLYKIAATATIDALRRAKAKREQQFEATHGEEPEAGDLPAPLVSHPGHSPERRAEQQELMRKIAAALARLAENRRRAVGLYLEGMTTQEIGDLLGWSEAKARNLVYRGLKELRDHLRAEGIEYEIDR